MGVKAKLKKSRCVRGLIMFFRKIFRKNVIKKKKGNEVKIQGLMNGAHISIQGTGNVCRIKTPTVNEGLSIFVQGNHNSIVIEEGCVLKDLHIWIEDNGNEVYIGKDTLVCGKTKLSCIEGTKISIGKRCMFSDSIQIRTGDSHSILDVNGKRINPSLNVCLDEHVWVGHGAIILKGVHIAQNCIVGASAVVTKSVEKEGVAIAGNPARIVKENITWDVKRLPIKEGHYE